MLSPCQDVLLFTSFLPNVFLFELINEFAEQIEVMSVFSYWLPVNAALITVLVPQKEVGMVTSSTHSGGQVG